MSRPPIVLLTDFGLSDGYPGVMKGVIYSFCSEVPIIDLSHGISPHNLRSAAFLLTKSHCYFPRRSIFVVVVDPGVGTTRKILYLRWADWNFLAPDNGVLTPFLQAREEIKGVYEVTQSDLFLVRRGRTFDGRDRFAPVAAQLARGFNPQDLGPPLQAPQMLKNLLPGVKREGLTLIGQVAYVDIFGNLITTIEEADLVQIGPGVSARVEVLGQRIPLVESYSEVSPGEPLAVVGGFGTLEIAINQGNAQKTLGVPIGQSIKVVFQD